MAFHIPRYNTIVNVRNFGDDMTNEKLYAMFAKFGTIKSYKLMTSPYYVDCQRFAYVAFEDADAAEDAIIELNGQKINDYDSLRLKVQRTHTKHPTQPKPKPVRANTTKLVNETREPNNGLEIFVQNLDHYTDTEELRMIFRRFGTIISAKIITENGRSKGYGFVMFTTPEAAANAVREKNGRLLRHQVLHVAIAKGKNMSKYHNDFISQGESHSLATVGMRNRYDAYGSVWKPAMHGLRRNDANRPYQRSEDYVFRNFRNPISSILKDVIRSSRR